MPNSDSQHRAARLIAGVLAVLLATPAHAYIDPVTGSFLVQGLIAGVMAVVGGVRSIRERVIGLFWRRRDKNLDKSIGPER